MEDTLNIVTHSGPFQADELIACALLKAYSGASKFALTRTRDPLVLAAATQDLNTWVIDVGMSYDPLRRNFDHHQPEFNHQDEAGILYASAGLIAFELFDKSPDEKLQRFGAYLRAHLLRAVDAIDNGITGYSNSYSVLIGRWNLDDPYSPEQDEAFLRGVDWCVEGILKPLERSFKNEAQASDVIGQALRTQPEGNLLILDEAVAPPVMKSSMLPERIELVVMPSGTQWQLRSLSQKDDRFASKLPAPESWRGLEGAALARVSGIKDAVFCHRAGFISIFETQKGALAAVALYGQPQGADAPLILQRMLDRLELRVFRVEIRFRESAPDLPRLRGVFGTALRRASRSTYDAIFERANNAPALYRFSQYERSGTIAGMNFVLFGAATELLDDVKAGWQLACELGMGKDRKPFEISCFEESALQPLCEFAPHELASAPLRLSSLTPFHPGRSFSLDNPPAFSDLAAKAARRFARFLDKELDDDVLDWVTCEAKRLESIVAVSDRDANLVRYSGRLKRETVTEGMYLDIDLPNGFGELDRLFLFVLLAGVGKNTAMNQGSFVVESR